VSSRDAFQETIVFLAGRHILTFVINILRYFLRSSYICNTLRRKSQLYVYQTKHTTKQVILNQQISPCGNAKENLMLISICIAFHKICNIMI